jgi:hypothetical protein
MEGASVLETYGNDTQREFVHDNGKHLSIKGCPGCPAQQQIAQMAPEIT